MENKLLRTFLTHLNVKYSSVLLTNKPFIAKQYNKTKSNVYCLVLFLVPAAHSAE